MGDLELFLHNDTINVPHLIKIAIAHTGRATAQRELSDLVDKGILIKMPGGGRSASYDLDWGKWSSFKENKSTTTEE